MTILNDSSSQDQCTDAKNLFGNGRTIWTFWDGNPPELVLRCIESMRMQNPTRPVVVVSRATLHYFLDDESSLDYPVFDGRPGSPDDFSSPQYLSDWVRLTLLEKYGGVWFDASVICTSPVESWITSDLTKITMFPMHANANIHGNWTMAAPRPGHPLIKAWRREFARVVDEAGSRQVPEAFCQRALIEFPALQELWYNPNPPPLPYLWVYLVLQVVLQKEPQLHSTIHLKSSTNGPMYRRAFYNLNHGITDNTQLSQFVANDLASRPLDHAHYDRHFIKLVGQDRNPCQAHLQNGTYVPGSPLDYLMNLTPLPRAAVVDNGRNLPHTRTRTPTTTTAAARIKPGKAVVRFRSAVWAVMATSTLRACH